MIDPQDLAHELLAVFARLEARDRQHARQQRGGIDLRAELGDGHAVGEMRSSRGEDVTPIEGRSPGARQLVVLVREVNRTCGATHQADRRGEQAIVRPDQHRHAVADLEGNRPPVGTDAGVDHCDDDAGVEVIRRPSKRKTAGAGVELGDAVGDVNDTNLRRDRTDHGVDHTDKLVSVAEIGKEGDRVVLTTGGVHDADAIRRVP